MTRPILDTVVQFFQEENWYYEQVAEDAGSVVLRMSCEGENGLLVCHMAARDEHCQLIFCSTPLMFWVPPEYRKTVAEFLTRANYGLAVGNFEMDFSDGEVRFRTSIDVEGGQLTVPLVKRLVYTNIAAMDSYLPIIKLVAFGYVTPERAITEVRNQLHQHHSSQEKEEGNEV